MGLELHVVLRCCPRTRTAAVKQLANAVEGRILRAASAGLLKLEKGIQEHFVRQLLIGHANRKGYVCRAIQTPFSSLSTVSI